jgi:hypothetical protein
LRFIRNPLPRVIPGLLATALASGGCSVILVMDTGSDSGANAAPEAASAVESGPDDAGHDASDPSDANAPGEVEADGSGGTGPDVAGGDSSALPDAGDESSALPDAGGESSALPDAGDLATTDQTPTKDAYVRDGAYVTTNFGSDVALAIKSVGAGFSRRTWVTFDIRHFTSITAAKLRLFVDSLDNVATNAVLARVFSTPASSNGWGELTITWKNAPAIGQQIASNSVGTPNVGTWVEWDVTSAVQTEIGGMFTLVIEAQGSSRLALFSSREGMYPPVLRITGN